MPTGENDILAILRRTGPGHEGVAGPHAPAVALQRARALLAQPAAGGVGPIESRDHKDSSTACATIWGLTLMSGCSPRMRSACCTVSLNTGAATRPP